MEKHVTQRLKDIVFNHFQEQKKNLNLDLMDLKNYKGLFVWKCSHKGTDLFLLDSPVTFLCYEIFANQDGEDGYYYYNGKILRKVSRDFTLNLILKRYEQQRNYCRITA